MRQGNVILAPICATIAWGLLAVWADLIGHMPALSASYEGLSSFGNMRMYWLVGLLIASCGLIALSHRTDRLETALNLATPLAASFGSLIFIVSCQQELFPTAALALIGIIMAGASYTWFSCSLCITLIRTQPPFVSAACVVGSLVVKTVAFQGISIVFSDSIGMTLAVALPLLIAVFAYGAESLPSANMNRSEQQTAPHNPPSNISKNPLRPNPQIWMLPQVVVVAIALATMRAITPLGFFGDPLELFDNALESMLGAIGVSAITVALSAILFIRRSSGENATDFLPGFFVIILAFFASTSIDSDNAAIAALLEMFITATEAFGHILFWLIVMAAVRTGSAISPYRFAGIATGLYNVFSLIWIAFFFDSGITNNAIVLCVMSAILLLVIWLADRKTDRAAERDKEKSGKESSLAPAERREELADEYSLSPREREVFALLAQGRSRSHISKALTLSEGTVKTHISHIYAKLGVSSKQEMIDLLLAKSD